MHPDTSAKPWLRTMYTSYCIGGILLCSLVSFIVRLRYPTSQVFHFLNVRLGYVPQYVFMYTFGTIVDPAEVILLPRHAVRAILAAITAVVVLTFRPNFQGKPNEKTLEEYSGGMNSKAATYALLNELVGYLLFANSFQVFRTHLNTSWAAITILSYAMFLVHAPVSVVVETLTDSWQAGPVTKTITIGTLNCLCTIGAAWLLRRLPVVGKVV